jgi:hypothetical protein
MNPCRALGVIKGGEEPEGNFWREGNSWAVIRTV